jgi:hypothetical protein
LSEIRAEELPKFRAWSEQFEPPADTSAYIAQEVSVTGATVLSELFFPELVEVQDCVLLATRYEPSNFDGWWERTGGDHTAIERVLNHLHLWDLFEPSGEEEERALDVLSRKIAFAWRSCAEARFPERSFEVNVTDEYGPTVVMSTRRQDSD